MEIIRRMTAEQTSTLGKIAVNHAQLDGIMDAVIGALVGQGTDDKVQERARAVIQGQQTGWLVECVIRLADFSAAHGAEVKAWAQAVQASSVERNGVLHAIWLIHLPEQTSMMMRRRRTGTSFHTVSIEDLREIETRQNALIRDGLRLGQELGAN